MPRTEIQVFRKADGTSPFSQWFDDLETSEPKAYANCLARILLLAECGHQLRRPQVEFLERGIYEIRAKKGRVNYRILYGFHGSHVAVLACGCTKEKTVDPNDIEYAVKCMELVKRDPIKHTKKFKV
jgi:putative component of toxin-antitoxin plasmid stabilization module